MAINFHKEHAGFELREKKKHKDWIGRYIKKHNKRPGTLTYIFTTNDHLRNINREFLQHDHFTDVISFDYTEGTVVSGDIFISIDQVRQNAENYEVNFEEELRRVMIHGVLHLIGYEDSAPDEKKVMRKMEDEALTLWEK